MRATDERRPERAWLVFGHRKKPPAPGQPVPGDVLDELSSLVDSAGGVVVGRTSQPLERENPATLIGPGAVARLKHEVAGVAADLVVFQNTLRPKQQIRLEEELEVKVLDRREVILDIFAQRARSREGKLQVEFAQLSFRIGRLTGARKELSRLGGGIGTRGPGEKKLEEDRRRIREQLRQIRRELAEVRRTRALHYQRRREIGYPVIAIVGYTNAGKSTLFNRLTGAGVLVADQLFATLDPTARRLALPGGGEAILVDTVGFIHDLPDELREAFLATLEGIGEARLILHVADASAETMEASVASVDRILAALGFAEKPTLLAVNKTDLARPPGAAREGEIRISAKTGDGIPSLLAAIERELCAHPSEKSDSTRLA